MKGPSRLYPVNANPVLYKTGKIVTKPLTCWDAVLDVGKGLLASMPF